jgi:hypothetical protein
MDTMCPKCAPTFPAPDESLNISRSSTSPLTRKSMLLRNKITFPLELLLMQTHMYTLPCNEIQAALTPLTISLSLFTYSSLPCPLFRAAKYSKRARYAQNISRCKLQLSNLIRALDDNKIGFWSYLDWSTCSMCSALARTFRG